jgi:1,4-dihydroxy-2-naphthoyl-CoA hydrolase
MYTYIHKIKLHETDAAGLLFFANQFHIIHDAYEALLEESGFGFAVMLKEKDYFLPIVHAESDYKKPLFVGDVIEIQIKVKNIGKTSFTFSYTLLNSKLEVIGIAETVHVTIDKSEHKKIPLPQDFQEKLESHL